MHEMSLATSIIEIVLEEIAGKRPVETGASAREIGEANTVAATREPSSAAASVASVHFRAGRLHSILPDSLSFYYDQMKLEHPALRNSRLDIEMVAERARCQLCHHEFEIDAPIFVCPKCAGPAVITDGQEMYIERIELGSDLNDSESSAGLSMTEPSGMADQAGR